MNKIQSRRTFLQVGAAAGAALLIGFQIPRLSAKKSTSEENPAEGSAAKGAASFDPNAFIQIDRQGAVTLIMPQVEMGQGIYTSIAMILGEELDVNWQQVRLEHAPPDDALYGNPIYGVQATGGSNSVRAFWAPLRNAGASARAMLVDAAAKRWDVSASTCRTENGEVIHAASNRWLAYGELVIEASKMESPRDVALKSPSEFRFIGHPLKRLDTPDKVNGKAQFGIDALPAGVKFAMPAECPVFGGKVAAVDDREARQVPGVRQIIVLDDFVAVVGDTTWAAKQGLAALGVRWHDNGNGQVSSDAIWQRLREASKRTGATAHSEGDARKALAQGDRCEATYELPLLAHATMEPLNCTVHVTDDSCEMWVGSQVLTRAQAAAMQVTGLPAEKVIVHNHLIGGGFGRRLEADYVEKAVRIAQQVKGPVKVIWSREEDMQHDVYRPAYHNTMSASLEDGRITAWTHRITGSSIVARWYPPAYQDDIDIDAVDGAIDIPYDIPNMHVEYVREEPLSVPTGYWRGVGPNNTVFAIESFVEELARKANRDPLEFRRDMLAKTPRLRAALDLVASKSQWGTSLPPRVGRGVAAQTVFGSYIATVVEAEVDTHGEVRVRRVVSAVDTGIAINPDTIVAQLEGGLIFGLTAALYGRITIESGRVEQSNFHDYRMMRMNEVPKIEVHLIRSGEAPGGIGETGTTAAAPALRNAILAATGVALRSMPVDSELLAVNSRA